MTKTVAAALGEARKALEPFADAARGLTSDRIDAHPIFYVPNDGRMHGTVSTLKTGDLRAAVPALASVNAVLAGKNTEKAESRIQAPAADQSDLIAVPREVADGVATWLHEYAPRDQSTETGWKDDEAAEAWKATADLVIEAPSLSASALDEARELLTDARQWMEGDNINERTEVAALDAEIARWLSANPKGPKE